MKKRFLLGMTALALVLALAAGCSAVPAAQELPSGTPAAKQTGGTAEGTAAPEQREQNVYMGKVSEIVGNEVTLELGTIALPAGESGAGADGGVSITPAGGSSVTITESSGGSVAAAPAGEAGMMPDSAEADDGSPRTAFAQEGADGSIQYSVVGGEDGSGLDLQYTGEKKSLVIPAGAKIYDISGGETTLDAVKKGSVLMVAASGTADAETVDSVTVMG